MRMRCLLRVAVVSALFLTATGALAQGITGSAVTGTVKDPDGQPVPEATVQLHNPSTGDTYTATTGASGTFFLDNVVAGGPYSLTVAAPGYEQSERDGIRLALGQRLKLDVPLKYFGETVEIVSFSDSLGDHARTGPATVVKEAAIAKLPLQGRNFTDLVGTDPRVSSNSIGGQNNRLNNIQIDGGANNDLFGLAGNGTPGGQANAKPLSIEAIKEFNVQVAPFDVRLGNFVGGIVNAVTKSGTNEFHGVLFGYEQNKSFAGFQDDPTFLNYNTTQFGAAIGGPIVKDKIHFFVAADLQQKQSAFGNKFQVTGQEGTNPTAGGFTLADAQRFEDILANKYGIKTAGNVLAPDLANPDRNVFAKVTAALSDSSHLEVSYNYVNARQDILTRAPTSPSININSLNLRDGYQLSNSGYGQANTTNTGRVKLTSNFDGGKISNEFLAGVSIIRDARDIANNTPLILVQAGSIGASPTFLAAGGERFSQSNILDQDIYTLQDNITFSTTNQRFTLGTSNEALNIRNVFLQAATGVWAFSSLDAFEAGTATAFQRRFGASDQQDPGTAKFNAVELGFYAEDEMTLLPNLTVTPGLRVDVPYLSKGVTNQALLASTALPIDTGAIPSGNALWSPRLGFNWDVDGQANTVVRGGAGVFSGRPAYVWVSNAYSINGLSQVQLSCAGATGVPTFTPDPNAQPSDCKGGTGIPKPPTNQGEIDYFAKDTQYPQNMRLALGVDRRLPWGLVANLDFLYTQDINGWYVTDENLKDVGQTGEGREAYGTFAASTATSFRSAPTRLDAVNLAQAVKVVNKNGAKVASATFQLSKTFGELYTVSAGYTYSRSQDLMSLTSSQALSNFQFAPLDGTIAQRNVRASAFDRPHKFTLTGTAALPYGFGAGIIYTIVSGLPYTWTVNGDVNGDGVNGNDLVYVPASAAGITLADPNQYAALSSFIDSQECLANARGGFVQRGACRNPWIKNMDLRFTWQSPKFKGEQHFEVQWDIFNVANLVNEHWGHFDQVAPFENAPSSFLRAVGYDKTNNRPVYTFVDPGNIVTPVYSPTLSRWRMQFGARYVF